MEEAVRSAHEPVEDVQMYKGFKIEFVFPHYYIYWNSHEVRVDMTPRDCMQWIDELLDWLHR